MLILVVVIFWCSGFGVVVLVVDHDVLLKGWFGLLMGLFKGFY